MDVKNPNYKDVVQTLFNLSSELNSGVNFDGKHVFRTKTPSPFFPLPHELWERGSGWGSFKTGGKECRTQVKIHLLRAAQGTQLVCRAQVLKPGHFLSIVEAEVLVVTPEKRVLVSKLMTTMAVLKKG